MIYGYCRISSKAQLENNSLEEQEKQILKQYTNAVIYKEQYTGKTSDRPIFNKLKQELKENDKLIVTKLDRLCRNVKEGLDFIQELNKKGVKVHILNIGLIEDTPIGNLIITNLLAFSEFERAMIIERTQAGKEIAKQKDDFREGRPKKYSIKQISHALSLLENNSYKEVEQMTGISKSTLIRAKNKAKQESIIKLI